MDGDLMLLGGLLAVVFVAMLWQVATPTWDKDLQRDDRVLDLTGRRW